VTRCCCPKTSDRIIAEDAANIWNAKPLENPKSEI
jgi:hypothetical protein